MQLDPFVEKLLQEPIKHEGWIVKQTVTQSVLDRRWRRRYLRVFGTNPPLVAWYLDDEHGSPAFDPGAAPHGYILLSARSTVRLRVEMNTFTKDVAYVMLTSSGTQDASSAVLRFSTTPPTELHRWLKIFQAAIKQQKGPDTNPTGAGGARGSRRQVAKGKSGKDFDRVGDEPSLVRRAGGGVGVGVGAPEKPLTDDELFAKSLAAAALPPAASQPPPPPTEVDLDALFAASLRRTAAPAASEAGRAAEASRLQKQKETFERAADERQSRAAPHAAPVTQQPQPSPLGQENYDDDDDDDDDDDARGDGLGTDADTADKLFDNMVAAWEHHQPRWSLHPSHPDLLNPDELFARSLGMCASSNQRAHGHVNEHSPMHAPMHAPGEVLGEVLGEVRRVDPFAQMDRLSAEAEHAARQAQAQAQTQAQAQAQAQAQTQAAQRTSQAESNVATHGNGSARSTTNPIADHVAKRLSTLLEPSLTSAPPPQSPSTADEPAAAAEALLVHADKGDGVDGTQLDDLPPPTSPLEAQLRRKSEERRASLAAKEAAVSATTENTTAGALAEDTVEAKGGASSAPGASSEVDAVGEDKGEDTSPLAAQQRRTSAEAHRRSIEAKQAAAEAVTAASQAAETGDAHGAEQLQERSLALLFKCIDTDSSGTLTRGEIARKLKADRQLSEMLGKAEAWPSFVLNQLDDDGDGVISEREFVTRMSRKSVTSRMTAVRGVGGKQMPTHRPEM